MGHELESTFSKYVAPIGGALLGEFLNRSSGGEAAARGAASVQSQAIESGAGIEAAALEQILPMLQQQLGLTKESFSPFIQAGTGALSDLQGGFQAPQGTTAGGLEDIIGQIMGGEAFGGLVEQRQRGIQGQLAAGGLTRSGTALKEAAAIPTDLAFQLENLLTGRQFGAEQERISGLESLVSGGRQATGAGLTASGDILSSIIEAITGKASIEAAGLRGSAEAQASGTLGAQQSRTSKLGNTIKTVATIASLFSDPRLKENIRVIGKVGPLNLVEWDWREEFNDTIVSKFPTMGYLSTQVKEFYPEDVHEFGGYDVIDYDSVNEKASCH